MLNTIAIIIDEIAELGKATNLSTLHHRRFYIFIGDRPSPTDLMIVDPLDNYLVLEGAKNLTENAVNLAIRASYLYTRANYLYFCWGNNLPSTDELQPPSRKREPEIFKGDHHIAASREFALFYDLEPIYDAMNDLLSHSENGHTEVELSQAMMGTPSTPEIIIAAVDELIGLANLQIMTQPKTETTKILMRLASARSSGDTSKSPTICYFDGISEDQLANERRKIPSDGAIVVCSTDTQGIKSMPFHSFKCCDGTKVQIYTRSSI